MSSPATSTERYITVFQIICGVVITSVGIVALLGWNSGQMGLVSVGANLPPTHYVSAVCFLICGVTVLLNALHLRIAAVISALILVLISTIELIEGVSGVVIHTSGIAGLRGLGEHDFHITIIGSATFLFIGLALVIGPKERNSHTVITGSMGAFALACGISTIIGLAYGYADLLRWGTLSEISLLGGIAYIFAGSAIISGSRNTNRKLTEFSSYIPVAVLIVSLIVSFTARQQIHVKEVQSINRNFEIEFRGVLFSIENEISRKFLAVERMADRWADERAGESALLEKDAIRFKKDFPEAESVWWVSSAGETRQIAPVDDELHATGGNLAVSQFLRGALKKSPVSPLTTLSKPLKLENGSGGVFSITPIYRGKKYIGSIAVAFRVHELFMDSVPGDLRKEFSVTISDGADVFFSTAASSPVTGDQIDHAGFVSIGGSRFLLRIRPYRSKLAELGSNIEDITLFLGTIISLLFSGAVYLAQRARRHERVTAESNRLLTAEIETRKRIEAALRETSTFREAILDGANYLIISTDSQGKITSFNRAAEILLGYKAEEVIGQLTLDKFHLKDEIKAYSAELARKFGYTLEPDFTTLVVRARDNVADDREWTYVCKNNTRFPVSLSVTGIFDEHGQIQGYLAIGRDNSQLHNTSLRLIESEERFKAFVKFSPAFVYIKDPDGRFVFSNENFEEVLKLEPGELIGKTVYDLTNKETADRVWKTEKRVLETGVPEESSEHVVLGDEILAHYLFVRFPLPSMSGPPSLGVIAIDLAPQLDVEEELRAANRAAIESSRMKSEFLANMSHEIRTPMNGVLGMLEVLMDTPLNESQREHAGVIQDSAKSLLTILNDILDFSKLEAGKLSFETIEFDIRATLENTIALFAEKAASKKVEISSLVDSDVPNSLLGDPGRIRQVLTNLLGNAVKFTEKGEVNISVSTESISADKVSLCIAVGDTGIGINADAQKYLFEAFVQADGSMVRKYGGTGLGLSISKQLVELMNGKISVESELGIGSTFTFTAEFGIPKEMTEGRIPVNLDGLKVLITDNLESNRKNISVQLEGLGIETVEASDGKSCISTLVEYAERNEPLDVVFLDLEMPRMNGFRTAELIKGHPKINCTKIVLMATNGLRGHGRESVKNGIAAYLLKPVRQVELFDCLATLVGGTGIETASENESAGKLITRHSLMEKRKDKGQPVLIVAGSVREQCTLSTNLELQGYYSEVVSDGEEAIEAMRRRSYALVLLDLDLTHINSVSAAEEFRILLPDSDIPIIGFTAEPGSGKRQEAIALGINECVTLPFGEEDLLKLVEKYILPGQSQKPFNSLQRSESNISKKYGFEEFVERLAEQLGSEMAEMTVALFAEDSSRHLLDIDDASGKNDIARLWSTAESLQILCRDIAAYEVIKACKQLQRAASDEDRPDIEEAIKGLRNELNSVLQRLARLNLQKLVVQD